MPERIAGCRILLVEDQYLLAENLRLAIEDAGGIAIGCAATGPEALALIAAHRDFHAAIVDLNLRGESADAVIDAILGFGRPVILTTGHDPEIVAERHRHLPLVRKPFSSGETIRLLARLLEAGR